MNKLFPINPVPNDENVIKQLQLKSFPTPKGKEIFNPIKGFLVLGIFGTMSICFFPNKLVGMLCISPVLVCLLRCIICYLIYLRNRSKKVFLYVNTLIINLTLVSFVCYSITFMVWGYFDEMNMYILDYFLFYSIAALAFVISLHKECKYYYDRLDHVPLIGKVPVVSGGLAGLAGCLVGKLLLAWTTPQVIGFLMYIFSLKLLVPVVTRLFADCQYYDVIEEVIKSE